MTASRLLDHPLALCNIVRRLAIEAGDVLLDHFDESGCDDASAAKACARASALIRETLERTAAGVPVVDTDDVLALQGEGSFWLVDPLNGRAGYMAGDTDFTVNIAWVRDGDPVIGVVYAPFAGELYAACGPGTTVRWLADNGQDKPVSVRPWPAAGLIVMAPRIADTPGRLDRFLENYKVARIVRRASSLKICAVAAGKADLYPCFGARHWREHAAGDAVLRGAGGALRMLDTGKILRYDPGAVPVHANYIAAAEFTPAGEDLA